MLVVGVHAVSAPAMVWVDFLLAVWADLKFHQIGLILTIVGLLFSIKTAQPPITRNRKRMGKKLQTMLNYLLKEHWFKVGVFY